VRNLPVGQRPAGVLIEAVKPITQVLERTDLILIQRARFEWPQAQFPNTLGWVTHWKERRVLGMDPGGEARERSQVIIDRRWGQPLCLQGALPGYDIAADTGGELTMSVALQEERLKALEMERNFLGHCLGADSLNRQAEISGHPVRTAVGE
jgi:hypothetical protein